jgi:hypothetical protein
LKKDKNRTERNPVLFVHFHKWLMKAKNEDVY